MIRNGRGMDDVLYEGTSYRFTVFKKELTVRESVLDAIRLGQWDFEPESVDSKEYDSTGALPGSNEKIKTLAERAEEGLPLWHPEDRRSFDDSEEAMI